MQFAIEDGRASGCAWKPARVSGGAITPSLIILHDTAGRLDKGSSVRWFQDENCTVSAHFVVERDGSVTQMVRTDRRAAHAGASKWGGRSGCNAFAVGIEIVNPGLLDEDGNAWFGPAADPLDIVRKVSREHGGEGWWLPYTVQQIDAVKRLCRAIIEEYPDCNEIVGHYHVSPGRKVDPSPLMDFAAIRAAAHGDIDDDGQDADEAPPRERPAPRSMAESTTGNTAAAVGTGGGVTSGVEIATAVARASDTAAQRGDPLSALDVLLAVAQSPVFWIGAATILGAVYIWLERRAKLVRHGV